VIINALDTNGNFAFQFQFAAKALRKGWNVSISAGSEEVITTDPNSGSCGHTARRFLSPVIQMKIFDENGNPVTNFDMPLNITTFAPFDFNKLQDVCFGYNSDDDTDWKCSDDFEAHPTKTKDVALAKTVTYHLTSFAVMLGSTAMNDSDCGLDWIAIASIAMIVPAASACVLLGLLYNKSLLFRALVGGYKRTNKISAIECKVNKMALDDCS